MVDGSLWQLLLAMDQSTIPLDTFYISNVPEESCAWGQIPARARCPGPVRPILIFADASYDNEKAGLGALLVDTLGGRPEVYDGAVIISQAEVAAVVARRRQLRNA